MTQLNITLDEGILKELMLGNRDDAVKKLLEVVFDAVLQAEATEQLGAEQYERSDSRITYRNGFRARILTTRVGSLTLHVPKFRDGTFSTQRFRSYARSEQALLLSSWRWLFREFQHAKSLKSQKYCVALAFQRAQYLHYASNWIRRLKALSTDHSKQNTPS